MTIEKQTTRIAGTTGMLGILFLLNTSNAAIRAYLDSGTSNSFTHGGSWAGNGTINDIDSSSTGTPTLINGFSGSGTLLLNDLISDAGNSSFLSDPNISLSSTYTLGGSGSADLQLSTAGASGGNASVFRQQLVLQDGNTSSVTLQVHFSSPLHARDTHDITGDWSAYYPWLLSASKAGGGNANFNLTISDITTYDSAYNITSGINGTLGDSTLFNGLGTLSEIGETLSLSATNIGDRQAGQNRNFIGIKRVLTTDTLPGSLVLNPGNPNGDGSTIAVDELSNGILSDHEQLVAQTATVVITPTAGGNFASGTQFYFTVDGYQGDDLFSSIPEPSSVSALIISCLLLIRRKRRD